MIESFNWEAPRGDRPLPEIVDIALEMIDMASRFYSNTDLGMHEARLRLKALSPEIKVHLNLFLHKRSLDLSSSQDGKVMARTLTEFVNEILIRNGQGAPSDQELELLFDTEP